MIVEEMHLVTFHHQIKCFLHTQQQEIQSLSLSCVTVNTTNSKGSSPDLNYILINILPTVCPQFAADDSFVSLFMLVSLEKCSGLSQCSSRPLEGLFACQSAAWGALPNTAITLRLLRYNWAALQLCNLSCFLCLK